jgi:hypothetical protein
VSALSLRASTRCQSANAKIRWGSQGPFVGLAAAAMVGVVVKNWPRGPSCRRRAAATASAAFILAGELLICPSYLHRTAVGITESRWAGSPNAPLSSISFPYVPEERLPPYLSQRHHPNYSTNLHGVLPGTRPGINHAYCIFRPLRRNAKKKKQITQPPESGIFHLTRP